MTKTILRNQKRPFLHYTPPKNWMNDPNGLVYFNEEFHLFYQHNPHEPVWGEMHWGHAVSKDGIEWDDKGIALSPYGELNHIFSGCAVVDSRNTSGLFKEGGGIVLLYTGVTENALTKIRKESQFIAFLNEETGKVVIPESNLIMKNPGLKDFRDPKVVFIQETGLWLMLLACGDHIRFYSSENLMDWKLEDKFHPELSAENLVLECPGIFENKDNRGSSKWVLYISVLNEKSRVSETFYLTGILDRFKFIADRKSMLCIDSGHDFYAPQHWDLSERFSESNVAPQWIGWMNSWAYADDFPSNEWNGIMSIMRETSLVRKGDLHLLSQKPISQIENRRARSLPVIITKKELQLNFDKASAYEIRMNLHNPGLKRISLKLTEGEANEFVFIIDPETFQCILDRTKCCLPVMAEKGLLCKSSPIKIQMENMDLIIILDLWTIEIFLNDGTTVFSEMLKWDSFPDVFTLSVDDHVTVNNFNCWDLNENK